MSVIAIHADPKTRTDLCAIHGAYEAKCYIGAMWSKCPLCALETDVRNKAEAEVKVREHRRQMFEQKIGTACIPPRFQNRTLQNFVADTDGKRKALAFATAFADGFDDVLSTGRGALFLGKPGTGKTHLAVAIALQIMLHDNRTALYTTVMRAIRRVKDTWKNGGSNETETQAVAALIFPDLLILDEVGVQFGSDTEKMLLFDVLNERYEKRRPTLLLSNLILEDVKGHLGERVFDRMREDGGEVVVFDWASHRGIA